MTYYRTKRSLPNGGWETLRGGSYSRGRAIRRAHKIARHTPWEGTIIIFDGSGRETYTHPRPTIRPWRPTGRKSSVLGALAIIMVLIVAAAAAIFVLPTLNTGSSAVIRTIASLLTSQPTPPPTIKQLMATKSTPVPTLTENPGSSWFDSYTTEAKAQEVLVYVNQVRAENGRSPLRYDSRVYKLAMARVNDMDAYNYMDHTNPTTGMCPDSIKTQYGLSSGEYLAENAYGFDYGGSYSSGLEQQAIDSWMTSRGHRYNLLYPHTAGVVACSSGGHCVFEGLNTDGFGAGCHTGAEGMAFWNAVGQQPYEG